MKDRRDEEVEKEGEEMDTRKKKMRKNCRRGEGGEEEDKKREL